MMTINMYLTPQAASHRVIDPANPMGDDHGGGSRAGFLGLVRGMGRIGTYKVRAIGPFNLRQQTIDGVEFLRLDQAHKLDASDVAHAYYDGAPLIENRARLRIWGHHTYIPNGFAFDWTDIHTTPSQHSLEHLRRSWDPHGEWRVVPNAVENLEGVEWAPVPGRCIYHTTPDRGLHVLLGMWPEIRARVPGATLHVIGDVKEMADAPFQARSVRGRRSAMLRENMVKAEAAGGVEYLGRLTRAALLKELSEANCFAFPADVYAPCETWSISIMEALWLGVPVVTRDVDSLGMWHIYAEVMHKSHPDWQASFIASVVSILASPDAARAASIRGKRVRDRWSFDKSAHELDVVIQEYFATKPKAV